jgi:hypothetical protein
VVGQLTRLWAEQEAVILTPSEVTLGAIALQQYRTGGGFDGMAAPASAAPRLKSRAARFVIVILALVAAACVVPQVLDPRLAPPSDEYANPEMVTIEGYSGSQEDPDVSPDGQYLFFDTHDDAGNPSHLFFARRIDYKTFKFIGRVPGINYQYEVEGMEDSQHNLYFVSPELVPQNGPMIFRGTFTGSAIESVAPVGGILPKSTSAGTRGLNFDLYITPDGKTLYFSDFTVGMHGSQPNAGDVRGAQLAFATKNSDGSFTRSPDSDKILKNVNALGYLVYNAAISSDGLTFAFNAARWPASVHIYIATRSSTTEPFGNIEEVTAAEVSTGKFSEVGSFSADGKYMYFHRVLSKKDSQLYVLTHR